MDSLNKLNQSVVSAATAKDSGLTRRSFLQLGGIGMAAAMMPRWSLAQIDSDLAYHYRLTAEPAQTELVPGFKTDVLAFNGDIPAPVIRARQGQPVRIEFTNKLDEPTTIHWHGLRIPIGMDGVPFLSQKPVMPGETFVYEFTPPDAGTFWYHPHMNSTEQLGRGFPVQQLEPGHLPRRLQQLLPGKRLRHRDSRRIDVLFRRQLRHDRVSTRGAPRSTRRWSIFLEPFLCKCLRYNPRADPEDS